jgi:photosystem II stability/assembly factor-like uncharacterized protein
VLVNWKEFNPRNDVPGGDGGTVGIDPTNAKILYAMFQDIDSIARSTDGGQSWSSIGAGLPHGACFTSDTVPPHWQVHPRRPTTLFASCKSLWQSTDSGSHWAALFTPPAGDSIRRSVVDPWNDLCYAASNVGRLFVVPGGTVVWSHPAGLAASDLQLDPINTGIAYVACGGSGEGRIFRLVGGPSGFAGTDITANLPPGLPAQAIAVHPRLRTLFAGTSRGVFQGVSPDGGATWSWTPTA